MAGMRADRSGNGSGKRKSGPPGHPDDLRAGKKHGLSLCCCILGGCIGHHGHLHRSERSGLFRLRRLPGRIYPGNGTGH